MSYLVIKSIHVIGVVCWFAGLFYIFRLYVYHTENKGSKEITSLLEVMERRLYYGITWPSMVVTAIMGIWMFYDRPDLFKQGWIHVKLTALVFLFAYHFYSGYVRKQFANGNFFLSSKQCRILNEAPTIVLLIVIPLALIKPF